jgi:hypothetical protein
MDNITVNIPTTHPGLPGDISRLARELRATSYGALTQREAIEQARAILARPAATVHGQFIEHLHLASLWAQWNGQRGTEKQCLRIMRQLSTADLTRMLAERGVVISEAA